MTNTQTLPATNENERDFAEAAYWLDFIRKTLPDRGGVLLDIEKELRDVLDPASKDSQ